MAAAEFPGHKNKHTNGVCLEPNIALNYTPDFIYTFDLDGRFTYVNRALLKLWNKTSEEAVGRNFFELDYPPELAHRLQKQIQRVIDSGEPVRDRTPFTGPDLETRHYEYIFVPVPGEDGKPSAVVGSTRDITGQQQAVAERSISDERLSFALEAGGGVGTWDWDIARDLVYCSGSFAKLFSVDPEQALKGVPIAEFTRAIHPEDRPGVAAGIQRSVETGEEYSAEYRIVQPGNANRWVMARGRCHRDAAGKPTRFPGVVFDITDRKRAHDALLESEGQFRTLAESIPNLAWMAHADGNIFWYNRRWYEYTGTTLEQMKGWGWQSVHDPAVLPGVLAKWAVAIGTGEPFEMVFPLRKADGTFRSFLTRIEPVRDREGKVVRWFGANTDITSQRMTEDELRRKNRDLEEFAYVASHDLQEPLRMVNIYTQLLLKNCGLQNEKLNQYAGFVQAGVSRMEMLLKDLLTFSSSAHKDESPLGTADLSQCLEEARSILKTRIEETGALITSGPLPKVRGDGAQILHVFQNLLSNAMKYRKADVAPVIQIDSEKRGNTWTISFKDNGIGFDQQYGEQIFGLFKRLHKNEYEGTGLGLAICKRIIEHCGGQIWAEGKLGEGSVFHFSLAAV